MWMQSDHAQSMVVRRYVRLTDPDRLYISWTTTIDSSPCTKPGRPPCPLPSNGVDHRPGAAGRARDDASSSMPASPTSTRPALLGGMALLRLPTRGPSRRLRHHSRGGPCGRISPHHLRWRTGKPFWSCVFTINEHGQVVRRWRLVMGCDPSTCLGLCDKAMNSFCIDGSVGHFAAAHFRRQRDAGSPQTR